MNTNTRHVVCLLVLSLVCFGCNKAGKLSQPSASLTPTGPVEFKQKWPLGERIEQDMDVKIHSVINIPGQAAPLNQETALGQSYGLNVLQSNPDGSHEVEMEFLSARMLVKTGDKTQMSYDSTKQAEPGKPDPYSDVYKKVIGAKIRYFLNASNGVDHIEGIDDIIQKVSATGQAAQVRGLVNENNFKQVMIAYLFLPPNAVQSNDTWNAHMEIPAAALGTFVMDYNCTFVGWEKHGMRTCARVDFQGTIIQKPDTGTNSSPQPFSMKIEDADSAGSLWFDPELGIIIDVSMTQDMTMIMRVPMGGKKKAASSQTITNQMTQSISIKLNSVK